MMLTLYPFMKGLSSSNKLTIWKWLVACASSALAAWLFYLVLGKQWI